MNIRLIMFQTLVAGLLLLGVGCSRYDASPGSSVEPDLLDRHDPDQPAVVKIIEEFFMAAEAGDVELGRKLTSPELADRVKFQAQPLSYDLREVYCGVDTAEVIVWVKSKSMAEIHDQFLVTFSLTKSDGQWLISRMETETFFGDY